MSLIPIDIKRQFTSLGWGGGNGNSIASSTISEYISLVLHTLYVVQRCRQSFDYKYIVEVQGGQSTSHLQCKLDSNLWLMTNNLYVKCDYVVEDYKIVQIQLFGEGMTKDVVTSFPKFLILPCL